MWRPFTSYVLDQPKQVGMEGVAPRDPVVPVAELVQPRVVALAAQRLLERAVRGRFSLTVPHPSTIGIVRSGRLRWTLPTKRAIRS